MRNEEVITGGPARNQMQVKVTHNADAFCWKDLMDSERQYYKLF
jgi:hypothetical protein